MHAKYQQQSCIYKKICYVPRQSATQMHRCDKVRDSQLRECLKREVPDNLTSGDAGHSHRDFCSDWYETHFINTP